MTERFDLKITSAIAIAGEIHKSGSIVKDVDERTAKDLLRRGKADLATVEDAPADEAPADAPAETGNDGEDAPAGKRKRAAQ